MSVRKALKLEVLIVVFLLLGACGPAVVTAQSATGKPTEELEVLIPKDGQRIGEGDDPLCPQTEKSCHKIRAEGRVPSGYAAFFAVEPVLVSPKSWIQPAIHRTRQDGSFSGLVYLGEEHNGAKEYFKIYVLACKDPDRLHTGEELLQFPKDCLASNPVEVYRVR